MPAPREIRALKSKYGIKDPKNDPLKNQRETAKRRTQDIENVKRQRDEGFVQNARKKLNELREERAQARGRVNEIKENIRERREAGTDRVTRIAEKRQAKRDDRKLTRGR